MSSSPTTATYVLAAICLTADLAAFAYMIAVLA